MSKISFIKISLITFLLSVAFSFLVFILNPLFLRVILEMTEKAAFFLISLYSLYILSLLSQQKPKKEKSVERNLLKKILMFSFTDSLIVIIIIVMTIRLGLWHNFLSAIFITSLNLFLLAIYPLILSILRKKCVSESNETKQKIIRKAINAFLISLVICVLMGFSRSSFIKK